MQPSRKKTRSRASRTRPSRFGPARSSSTARSSRGRATAIFSISSLKIPSCAPKRCVASAISNSKRPKPGSSWKTSSHWMRAVSTTRSSCTRRCLRPIPIIVATTRCSTSWRVLTKSAAALMRRSTCSTNSSLDTRIPRLSTKCSSGAVKCCSCARTTTTPRWRISASSSSAKSRASTNSRCTSLAGRSSNWPGTTRALRRSSNCSTARSATSKSARAKSGWAT